MENVMYLVLLNMATLSPIMALIPTVHIGTGLFSGYIWGFYSPDLPGVYSNPQVFRGIRFAKPTKRWEDPEYDDPEDSFVYRAWYQKPMCPQGCSGPSFLCIKEPEESEDCLFMDIWAPEDADYDSSSPTGSNGLPVMVFLHGGNFKSGSGLIKLYTPAVIVDRGDVIVVVINYRHGKSQNLSCSFSWIPMKSKLGAMGFLATGTGTADINGNYGIKDQRMAMYWINQNIKYFGGNPNKVTLFGQSAGCQSIAIHLMNHKSDSYFQQAILQSCPYTIAYKNYSEAENQTKLLATSINCPTDTTQSMLTCLKNKPAAAVVRGQLLVSESKIAFSSNYLINNFQEWGPVLDVDEVPRNLLDLSMGISNKPVILGFTRDEAILYIYSQYPKMTYDDVLDVVSAMNLNTKNIGKRYPLYINNSDARAPFSDIATDYIFRCPTLEFAKKFTGKKFIYEFDSGISIDEVWGEVTQCYRKACHGADLGFVFQAGPLGGYDYTPLETKLSDEVITYWTNFAINGNPGRVFRGIRWKPFGKMMIFQQGYNKIGSSDRKPQCKFWAKKGYNSK